MQAIKQIVKVKNHKFSVTLPNDFTAETVEIIILASNQENDVPDWQQIESQRRLEIYLKNPDSASDFDAFCQELENEIL